MSDRPSSFAEARPALSTRLLSAAELGTMLSTIGATLTLWILFDTPRRWFLAAFAVTGLLVPFLAGYLLPRWKDGIRRGFPLVLLASTGVLMTGGGTLLADDPYALDPLWLCPYLAGCAVVSDRLVRHGTAAAERTRPSLGLRMLAPCALLVPAALAWGWWRSTIEPPLTRLELLSKLRFELLLDYPHWDTSAVESAELYDRYEERLLAADSVCGDDAEPCLPFLHALRDMLAELRNGHTEVLISGDVGRPVLGITPVGDQLVVTVVPHDSDAAAQGIERGMILLEVDGLPASEAVKRVPPWLRAYASPATSLYQARRKILSGPPDEDVQVTLERRDGTRHTASLERTPVEYRWEVEREPEDHFFFEGPPVEVYGSVTEDGLGYLRLLGFSNSMVVRDFDEVLDDMLGTPGLILDLRKNYGGDTSQVAEIAGRFLDGPLRYGHDMCISYEPYKRLTVCVEFRAGPRGTTYQRPVAVLIDRSVYSAGEVAAYLMCRVAGARCFGEPTAGETDTSVHLPLPGGLARVGFGHFLPAVGPPIHGEGLTPDVVVRWTVDDVRNGRDPVLEAARSWLLEQSGGNLELASAK